jgi:CheY-like chemotaxis protein
MKACLQEGILAYVRKPYDPRELFKTIEKYVPVSVIEPKAKARPAGPPPAGYQGKLEEIEKEFKKNPEKAAKRKESIDELLKGALADFKIPLGKEKPQVAPAEERPTRTRGRPKSILLIDDDTTFAKQITLCLTEHGYDVMIAADGVSGLKQAFQQKPDLILLNLILPGSSGETVLSNLRKAPDTEHLPIFIMSGLLSPKKLEEKAREIGAQGFISKPVEPEDLLYIIDSVIGS